ncbi:uncharacterized protein LOC119595624 [Penaeus monodon]|uniref:uncharacterized protein LOC119595624 n=1 Tax=Penaeus monodon TaxID=6687 RepID=UPI0018A6EB35|nr:uncharacterized protein LOC119595624 [Penaeus monodon]
MNGHAHPYLRPPHSRPRAFIAGDIILTRKWTGVISRTKEQAIRSTILVCASVSEEQQGSQCDRPFSLTLTFVEYTAGSRDQGGARRTGSMLLGRLNVLASLDQRDDPAIAEITQVKEGGCKLQEDVKSNSLWPTNSESKYVGRICSGFSNDGARMLMTPLNAKCTPLTKLLWTYTTQYHLLVKSMNLFDLKMSSSAQGHLCLKRDIF